MSVGRDAKDSSSRPKSSGTTPTRLQTLLLGLAMGVALTQTVHWLGDDSSSKDTVENTEHSDSAKAKANDQEVEAAIAEAAKAVKDAPPPEPEPEPLPPDHKVTEGVVEPNQFIAQVFEKAGLTAVEGELTVRALKGIFDFRKSRPGDKYRIESKEDGTLVRFEYTKGPAEVYLVSRSDSGELVGDKPEIELTRDVIEVVGKIDHSLYNAFLDAGESPNLAMSLAEAFQFDIDFFHDTRKGDTFRFFVEKFTHEGELVRYGQIYAAEYIGMPTGPIGKKKLYWYENEKTKTKGFYDEEGKAAQRAFLRSPLRFTRISSPYGYRRHPILGKRHFHGGIDYAAPTGTPVQAVGSGRVIWAGRQGAAGKMVKIQHSGGYQSLYLHLSRIMVRKGQSVSQSTVIGKVGSTGRSTGPHLDFRLKHNGKYLNPRSHVAPRTKAIPRKERKSFQTFISDWIEKLSQPAKAKPMVAQEKSAEEAPAATVVKPAEGGAAQGSAAP